MNFNTVEKILNNLSGSSFIGLDTLTPVTLLGGKKNEFQGRVNKLTTKANVIIFQNKEKNGYAEMVKRRLASEGKDPESFTLGQRPWGVRIENSPFIEHKGEFYLEVVFLKSGKSKYLVDGVATDAKSIPGLKLEEKEAKPESQGGLENKVIVRTINVKNIKKITVDGKDYE